VASNRASLAAVAALAVCGTVWGGEEAKYRRTVARYEVPDVALVNQDGAEVRLPQALGAEKPVLLDFFFSSCTTVCPVLSVAFSGLLKELGPHAREVRVISIAIDPDHDTPEVLRGYRTRFGAGPEWELLTGSREDVDRVRKTFGAYTQNKVTHRPLTFLRPAGSHSWVRIEGLVGASELMAEYRALGRP
jgi:protein SCO1/2